MNYPESFSQELVAALGAEFSPEEVEFLPRATSGGMALGLPYIDARDVMRRLDAVVGPANWQFDFDVLSSDGKMVRGKLTVFGVTKCDAGEASQEEEPLKSAVSDALKRCAVHFGVGRYLYYLPRVWAPFDPQKRRFIEPPRLDPAAVRRALALCGVSRTEPEETRRAPGHSATATNSARELVEGRSETRPARTEKAEKPAATRNEAPKPVSAVEKSEAAPAAEPITTEAGVEAAPRPTIIQGGAVEAPAGGRRSPWAAGVTANDRNGNASRVADGGSETAGGAPESGGDRTAAGALSCARPECGRPITRGQHEMSVRNYGKAFCPACQKLQARAA